MLKNRQRSLRSTRGPAAGIADRRKRIAMERRGPVKTQSFEMVRRSVAFVAREAILRINGVPLFHAGVAVGLSEDGRGGDGDTARVAFDQRLLLDQNIEFHGVDEEVVRRDSETLKRSGHGLTGSLIDIPGVNPLRVDFSDGPGESVFANALAQLGASLGGEFFGVVEADNAAFGVENHGGGDHRAEQRATSGFVNAGDARPTQFARRSLETGRAEPAHRVGILARCRGALSGSFLDGAISA